MDAFEDSIPDWVQPGTSFRVVYGAKNPNNQKLHVRGLVDGHAVVRWWRRRVKGWEYKVMYSWDFHLRADYIQDIKKGQV